VGKERKKILYFWSIFSAKGQGLGSKNGVKSYTPFSPSFSVNMTNFLPTKGARALHWVLKIGNLKQSMAFFENVLGMRVMR